MAGPELAVVAQGHAGEMRALREHLAAAGIRAELFAPPRGNANA